MTHDYTRRDFLRLMGIAAGGLMLSGCEPLFNAFGNSGSAVPYSGPMPYRALGGTGQAVSLFGLGGEAAIESSDQELAVQIINEAIDLGVNYLDTSWFYGSGQSETNLGQVMPTRRNEVFLASKSAQRSYSGVMSNITESLNRLNTDHLDLYQLHDVRTSSHLNSIFASNGALKAMEELRDQGVIRFIGITGHYDPAILLQAINQFPFDAILLSLNAADTWHRPFQEELFQTAVQKKMGIIGMKVAAKGHILGPDRLSMEQAMHYVYSFPVSTAIVGIHTLQELAEDVAITNAFPGPLSPAELEALELATLSYQGEANYFKRP